jgi:hypothetical protein
MAFVAEMDCRMPGGRGKILENCQAVKKWRKRLGPKNARFSPRLPAQYIFLHSSHQYVLTMTRKHAEADEI